MTPDLPACQEQEASALKAQLTSAHARIKVTQNHVDKATPSPDAGAAVRLWSPRAVCHDNAVAMSSENTVEASKNCDAKRFPTKWHHEALPPLVSSQQIPDVPHRRRGECHTGPNRTTERGRGSVDEASAAAESEASSGEDRDRQVDCSPPVDRPDPKFEADRFDADICELFLSLRR